MRYVAICDAGPLIASANRRDAAHARSFEVFQRADLVVVYPSLVVAEASYFIGRDLGPMAEARFLRNFEHETVLDPEGSEWDRIADLVLQYGDFPLGGTDASVIALAERLNTDTIITLDRRHFGAVRPAHCEAFRLLPE